MKKYFINFYDWNDMPISIVKTCANEQEAEKFVKENYDDVHDLTVEEFTPELEAEYAFELDNGIIEVITEDLSNLSENTARSPYEITHNIYYDKKQLINDGFTEKYSSSDWYTSDMGYFEDVKDAYGNSSFWLYKRNIKYKNPENNETATLIQFAYEYTIEERYGGAYYGHKDKKKLISKEEFNKARTEYTRRQNDARLDKLTKELNDLKAKNFKIDNIGTPEQVNSLSQRLEVFEEEGLMTHDEANNIRQELDREINSTGWCVVLVLSDSYAKSQKDSYSKIEKSNLTKRDAFETADLYNEPVYTQLRVGYAWKYEPMKIDAAKKFLAQRNKEEDALKRSVDEEINSSAVDSHGMNSRMNESSNKPTPSVDSSASKVMWCASNCRDLFDALNANNDKKVKSLVNSTYKKITDKFGITDDEAFELLKKAYIFYNRTVGK